MPKYDYKCKECGSGFDIICGINDSRENIACNKCGSTNLARIFNVVVLKGQRAKGYSTDDSAKVKEPETAHEPQTGEQCSPEEDYI